MRLNVRVSNIEELKATMQVGKRSYSEAVCRMQLRLEELAAGVSDVRQLQDIGSGKQDLAESEGEGVK